MRAALSLLSRPNTQVFQMAYTLRAIAEALGAQADGDLDIQISGVSEPGHAAADELALAMDPKFGKELAEGAAQAAILWEGADWRELGLKAAIFAPRSRYVLAGVGRVFDRPLRLAAGIHPSAVIEEGAQIGKDVSIGAFTYVGPDTVIGDGCRLMNHVSIGADVRIGRDALIHPQVHIGARVVIGDRFIAQPGAMIGGDGFSFVSPSRDNLEAVRENGKISEASRTPGFARINSLGSVRIGDDVEVGANAAIDRGTVIDTVIGNGSKIDDLVDIGHNVQIGQHCLLCGQVGIAGSTKVGDRVVLAGQVGVADHITIGSDVIVAAGSGVGSSIAPGKVMMGYPAGDMKQTISNFKAIRRIPRALTGIEELEKRVSKLDPTE